MTDSVIHPDREFRQFLEAGRFMIQRSASSGRHVFYPRVVEPGTGAADLEWVEASGLGTVYSCTTVRARDPKDSYNVSLIDLVEGPRMMSCVVDVAPQDVRIGMTVRARIDQGGEAPRIVFAPVV